MLNVLHYVDLLHYIDLVGTFIFALSGASAGIKKGFDLFGVLVLSAITAVGGGVIRDICISVTPPAGLVSFDYLICILVAMGVAIFLEKRMFHFDSGQASVLFDAIGLGFFAAFGANKVYQHTSSIQLSILLGCISAVGGGVMRDILCTRSPIIFQKEIYASAAMIGASVELLGSTGIISASYSIWLAIFVCSAIRLISLYYDIDLPAINAKK